MTINDHEDNFYSILKKQFYDCDIFRNPIYYKDNNKRYKSEFADIVLFKEIEGIKHFVIFELFKRDDYLNEKGRTKYNRWVMMERKFKEKRSQIKCGISHLNKGGWFFEATSSFEDTSKKEMAINKYKFQKYHYFIVIDGYTEYMSDIYKEKTGGGEDGGVALITKNYRDMWNDCAKFLNNKILKSGYINYLRNQGLDTNKLQKIKNMDDEFFITLEDCIVEDLIELDNCIMFKNRIIHVIDSESYDYSQYENGEKQNIFSEFFNNDLSQFLEYLIKKEYWILNNILMKNHDMFIQDERSLLCLYALNGEKFPKNKKEIFKLFKFFDDLVQIDTPVIQDCRISYNDNLEVIRVKACFEDFYMLLKNNHEWQMYYHLCKDYRKTIQRSQKSVLKSH